MRQDSERIDRICQAIKQQTGFQPKLGLVLGSGLGDFADQVKAEAVVPYGSLEGFPHSTAPGHKGRFIFAYIEGVPCVLMQGRVHYYEGYSMADVVLPIRVMAALGVGHLILTNAAGGVNPAYKVGDFMLITDQIASLVPSPLLGPNEERLGPRFPDMTEAYDFEMRQCLLKAAANCGLALQNGVYLQTTGPQFETPAEIRLYRCMGADAVGMSTACEVIAARHRGIKTAGISCITNMAAGLSDQPLSSDDVNETARKVGGNFSRLLQAAVSELSSLI
ncbi:MAG: purine-nucleoside phosphorylase [Oscillospiraceae bacterium]|nr:purine-nucleoside phosphorylase [Oscillospiraceae bacterium]MDD4368372.1 purine-nucleoside phosphorylase [Oscillospiraceae bacterium]